VFSRLLHLCTIPYLKNSGIAEGVVNYCWDKDAYVHPTEESPVGELPLNYTSWSPTEILNRCEGVRTNFVVTD